MTSSEFSLIKGLCSILESMSTHGYSQLLLGFVTIPVGNVYHDSNGKGELHKPFVIYAGPTSGVYLRVRKPFTTSTPLDALLPLPLAYCLFLFGTRTCDAPLLEVLLPCPFTTMFIFYLVNLDGCELFRLTFCKGG